MCTLEVERKGPILKVMVGTVESHGPFVLDFKAIDQIFRHMVQ